MARRWPVSRLTGSGRDEPVGLIAGTGRAPLLVAHSIRKTGRPLVVVGLSGFASSRLRNLADVYVDAGVARLGTWTAALRKNGVNEAVMIGGVRKKEIYSPLRVLRYIPDIRSAWLWYFRIRRDKRDNALLLAIAEQLQGEGIELVSSLKFCPEHLATEGQMTRTDPPKGAVSDIEFGWRIARASADLDIGQSLAVKERDIIAVEAMEGTDAMIRRAGELCRVGGWTMVKVARPKQDMRFDVPAIGPDTLRNLKEARCACLVVEAGKTFIVDKPSTLALADQLGIAIIGKKA